MFKYIQLLIILALFFISGTAHAKGTDDTEIPMKACLVAIDDVNTSRYVNVNYIRMVSLDNRTNGFIVNISLAGNYKSEVSQISIYYQDFDSAQKAMKLLYENIKNCK